MNTPKPQIRLDLDAVPTESHQEFVETLTKSYGLPLFSGQVERAFSLDAAGGSEACPQCGGPLKQQMTKVIYATSGSPRTAIGPVAFFCATCPTAVVDLAMIKGAMKPGLEFQGVLGFMDQQDELILFKTWNGGEVVHVRNPDGGPQTILTFDEASLRTNPPDALPRPRLSLMPDPERQVIRLPTGSFAGLDQKMRLVVCDHPFCACQNVEVFLFPVRADASPKQGLPYFVLDLEKETLVNRDATGKANPDSLEVADAILGLLTPEDWKELKRYFLAIKREQEAHCLENDARVEFSEDTLDEKESGLIAYQELFPFTSPLTVEDEGQEWVWVETFPLSTTSSPQEILLQWFREDASSDPDAPTEPDCLFWVNVTQGRMVGRPDGPMRERGPRLWGLLRRRLSNWSRELRRRQRLVNSLFKTWAARQRGVTSGKEILTESGSPLLPEPAREPGRNDPCPCGSGRKFKKCCGNG